MKPIYSPIAQDGLQIAEFKLDDILELISGPPQILNIHSFNVNGEEYTVNFGSPRYHVLKRSRVCACCGIIGNRAILDLDEQQTKELGVPTYHVNIYAQTYDALKGNIHFVLMTRDHIVPRSLGGAEDMSNYQTLCYNCNSLKDVSNMSLEQMQKALFPAYRAYRSSLIINKTKELTEPYHRKIEGNQRAIDKINEALLGGTIQNELGAKERILHLYEEMKYLIREVERIEIEAQVSGQTPEKVDLRYKG